jgi:hypothetical protein
MVGLVKPSIVLIVKAIIGGFFNLPADDSLLPTIAHSVVPHQQQRWVVGLPVLVF